MNGFSKNNVVMLAALIVMMLIAAAFDYRLQISTGGIVFERSNTDESPSHSKP
jgi:hypothetical protein